MLVVSIAMPILLFLILIICVFSLFLAQSVWLEVYELFLYLDKIGFYKLVLYSVFSVFFMLLIVFLSVQFEFNLLLFF